MLQQLPTAIATKEEAIAFIKSLHEQDYSYHPEDDAHDIVWTAPAPTKDQCDQLNKLMQDIYTNVKDFDPCELLVDLTNEYPTQDLLDNYSWANGFNTSMVSIDSIVDGTTTLYCKVSRRTGQKSKYGGEIFEDHKWYVQIAPDLFKCCNNPYSSTSK